ncbi:DNA repair helicase [Cryptosporidium felis]|nr:DNA repair helicase [Cryptosporidium felis]
MNHVRNEYLVEGYTVYFPYNAYKCQLDYMQKVLYSLKNKKHALLESPTGTGKTLCLLASTLAFQRQFLINYGSLKKPVESSSLAGIIKSEGGSIEVVGITSPPGISEINRKDAKTDLFTPRIIYSSRTHSQLSQVMRELKSSGISEKFTIELFDTEAESKLKLEKGSSKKRPVAKGGKKLFKATILGSRDQMCVHPKISKFRGNALIKNCRKITKEGKCRYHNNLKQANITGVAADIQDIEELKSIASSSESGYFCPFYATREIQNVCNIVLLPYNYLLDSITRQNLKMDLTNTVLILDEAHNIESVAEEAYSFDLRDIDLALSQKGIQNILEATKLGLLQEKESEDDSDLDISFDIEVAVTLATGIHLLSKNLKEIPCPVPPSNTGFKFKSSHKMGEINGITYPGSHIYTFFGSSGFGKDNFQVIDECLTCMINFGQNLVGTGGNVSNLSDVNSVQINARLGALERFQRCLRLIFNETVMKNTQWFKLYVHYEPDQYKEINTFEGDIQDQTEDPDSIENGLRLYLSFWCFSAAAALSSLVSSGVRSMIITSGTLSPLDTLAQQFTCSNVSFDVFLENDHVIDSESQLWAATIEKGSGINNTQLIGSYEARSNPSYFTALGSVVMDCVKRIPDGVLLFFGSYTLMDQAIKQWTDQGILERIKAFKSVFIEPRNSFELGSVLDSYMECLKKGDSSQVDTNGKSKRGNLTGFIYKSNKIFCSGSLLIAVCRGKVSEGINFSDNACRGVIIAGLPFPSITDPKVSLKKQYMDESNMDGRQWYNQQAIRAVNQAIGRVVRHRNDFGVIILADKRFNQHNIYTRLSKWIRTQTKHLPQLDSKYLDSISDFFERKLFTGVPKNGFQHSDSQFAVDKTVKQIRNVGQINRTQIQMRNPSVVSFPNLKTEINTVLRQVDSKEELNEKDSSNSNSDTIPRPIPGLETNITIPWKKVKTTSHSNSPKSFWTCASPNGEKSSLQENQKKTNLNFVPVQGIKNQCLMNKAKNILRIDEFNRLKPYLENLNKINSSSLKIIAESLLPNYIIDEGEISERKFLSLELLKELPNKYKFEFESIIENTISNSDLMNDKALVDALENEL